MMGDRLTYSAEHSRNSLRLPSQCQTVTRLSSREIRCGWWKNLIRNCLPDGPVKWSSRRSELFLIKAEIQK
jgi:hypothetical protein